MSSSPAPSGKVSEAVSRVEAQLAELWAAPDDATGEPKVRASMLNLVVASSAAELERLRADGDNLTQTHPGRVLLVTLDGRIEPWDVRASVSAVCRKDGGTVLCSDRIELAFGAMASARAASVVGSLSLSEVPTIVESGRGAPAALVDALAARSNRLVVDSAHTPWSRIAEVARATKVGIGDRNFVRAYTWRNLVARFFDDAPRAVRAIRRVEVSRTDGGGIEPAALLLGWLGGRLGWRFEEAARAVDSGGGAVEIALFTDPRSDVGPGEVTAVPIRAELDGAPLDLACARTAPRVVRWTQAGALRAEHEHPLGHRDETWVLVKAIDATECDAVYRETARAAASFCAVGGGQGQR